MASDLPLDTRFTLGPTITDDQRAFLDRHGFLHFTRVATTDEVATIVAEMERIERDWIGSGRTRVFGIPLFFGSDHEGKPFLQRLAFTSVFSERIHAFVRDPRTHYIPMQNTLSRDDGLMEYLQHTGSGLFAVPPGVPDDSLVAGGDGTPITTSDSPFVGQALFP